VRIDFEQQVQMFFFDAAYDNVRVVCRGLGALPGTLDYGRNATQFVDPMFQQAQLRAS
jgi:hypothetical protein